MRLADIIRITQAHILWGEHLADHEIRLAFGADLMSDVLACEIQPRTLLITGLANTQVMRTAEMVELAAILFVRGKKPDTKVLEMAKEIGVPVLSTSNNMFETCGILYKHGLNGSW